jgi:hypothetical protein
MCETQREDSPKPDLMSPRMADDDKDHLHIFLGRTNRVSTSKSANSPPVAHEPSPPPASQPPEPSIRYTYDQGLHPHLADQLHTFGQQLSNPSYPQEGYYDPQPPRQPMGYSSQHLPPIMRHSSSAQSQQYGTPPPRTNSQGHSSSSASPVENWAPTPELGSSIPVLLPRHTHHASAHAPYPMPQRTVHLHSNRAALPPRLDSPPPTSSYDPMTRDVNGNTAMMNSGPLLAASQHGLQETWTSFMQQASLPVGPTQFPFNGPNRG